MARRLLIVVAAVLTCVASGSAEVPPNQTLFLGYGTSHWRIGARFRTEPDLVRYERHRENDGPGCIGGPVQASRIDYYPGIRLSWNFSGHKRSLTEIATTRPGDRSAVGFTIGQATLRQVRARYSRAQVLRKHLGSYALGRAELIVYRRTGYESGKSMDYWFDARGLLVGLATGVSGC